MSSKSTKSKNVDIKEACTHLETLNQVSHSLQPLCHCKARDLVLGKTAIVCSVCSQYKKSDNQLVEMYIADALESDVVWDDEDFYEVIKDEESEDEEEEDDDDMPKKRKPRKKKVVEEDEDLEDDEEEKKKKAAEEEKISEELFGRKEKEVEEEGIQDDAAEIHEVYDRKERKLAKAKEKGIDIEDDDALELIDDLEDEEEVGAQAAAVRSGGEVPDIEIEITKDGKQRCPYCKKEFASVARHVTRCKYVQGPQDIEAVKKAAKKLKK